MYKDFKSKKVNNYILPKLKTFSTQNFLNNFDDILNSNNKEDFVVIGVYNNKNPTIALTYTGDDIFYHLFYINVRELNIYDECKNLIRIINNNKNKKFIIVSHDGFELAQSVARFISEFILDKKEREEYMVEDFEKFKDDFELSFWMRRAYFKIPLTDEEITIIYEMKKNPLFLKLKITYHK